jgi:hypothetical protein
MTDYLNPALIEVEEIPTLIDVVYDYDNYIEYDHETN